MIVNDSRPAPGGPILGIDPGSVHTGYGLIQTSGRKITVLTLGTVSPKTTLEFAQRLAHIHRAILNLITTFQPGAMALEDIFTHKNTK